MKPKISIVIPSYNQQATIEQAIRSAQKQNYLAKEIIVVDDKSRDNTPYLAKQCSGVRVVENSQNIGIGKNLVRCMEMASAELVLFLCGDDLLADDNVAGDIVRAFEGDAKLGMIGRKYYEFIDGIPGAVGVHRDKNILTSSCNPSGMAFRKQHVEPSNKIFVEMPRIVAQYLIAGWHWTILPYDTVAVRIHPGGNTATKEWYYTESPTQNWYDLCGQDIGFYAGFVQYKNRCPKILWREICRTVKLNKLCLSNPSFWFYCLMALIVPSSILRRLSSFYRHRIGRITAKIITRCK